MQTKQRSNIFSGAKRKGGWCKPHLGVYEGSCGFFGKNGIRLQQCSLDPDGSLRYRRQMRELDSKFGWYRVIYAPNGIFLLPFGAFCFLVRISR